LRAHSGGNHFHSNPVNYNFHGSHIISPTSPELSIPTVSTKARPKSCIHCVHLLSGSTAPKFGSIHSTLAYAKCRCHRPDTSKLYNQTSSRENHCGNTNGRLFKRVGLPYINEESSQTLLPSIARNLDHHSEQPLTETSCSELASSSNKFPVLKRYDHSVVSWLAFITVQLWYFSIQNFASFNSH